MLNALRVLMKCAEQVYLSDVNLHIVLAQYENALLLTFCCWVTYICQTYLSYICLIIHYVHDLRFDWLATYR